MRKCLCPFTLMSVDDAYDYIYENLSKKTSSSRKYIEQILTTEFLPHLGMWCNSHEKGMFLGMMVSKILKVFSGERIPDDRDHMSHKRIELTGELMEKLILGLLRKKFRHLQKTMEEKGDYDIKTGITRLRITSAIYQCFTSSTWGVPKTSYRRQGEIGRAHV